MQNQDRVIFHCDCNSFYASVELLDHPELRSLPVAVGGDPEGRHGIILAKNEAAKRYGVQTAETLWQARAKCPGLLVLSPHRKKYSHFYRIINQIYARYTDLVEPFSIDESWLDVTGSWHLFEKDPVALANRIRNEVHAETGLTISVGVSWNKVFAKLGSDYKKPNATTVFSRENYRKLVWDQPVSNMLFVGRSAQATLKSLGVETIGQLALADETLLRGLLGKQGPQLRTWARGEDTARVRRVGESDPAKSVGNGMTFRRDLVNAAEVEAGLTALCDEVAGRLRRHALWAGGVQVTIKGSDFKSIQRQCRLPQSTHLARDLVQASRELVKKNWPTGRPIRLLTVTAVNLTSEPFAVQQSLFDDAPKPDPKREKLEASLDAIRKKYGRGAVAVASTVAPDLGLNGLAHEETDDPDLDEKVKGPL